MSIYTLHPEQWISNRNKLIANQAMIWGGGIGLGVLVGVIQNRPQSRADLTVAALSFLFVLLMYGTAGIIFTTFKMKTARQGYYSYELTVGEDFLSRKQWKMPEIRIRRDEITRVQAVQGKGLMVKTADPVNTLWVPSELAGFSDVTKMLMEWAPSEEPRTSMPLLYNIRAGITITMLGGLAMFSVHNPLFVTLVAVPYLGLLLYAALFALRSPNSADSGLKVLTTTAVATIFIVVRVMAVWQ